MFCSFIGAIIHLGKSIHAGHYVSYLRKAEKEYVLFNDAKVAKTETPVLGKAYILIYR
jgi:ubiquitin carboxyl-terminal hydrolase 5/13